MAAPARFLFDTDFSTAPSGPAKPGVVAAPVVPMMPVADHEAALAAVRAEAEEEGRRQGRAAAEARAAERVADEAARLVAVSRALLASLESDRAAMEAEAIELAVAVGQRLAATLVAREPLEEIRALVRDCLGPLRKAPHLVIRLAADHCDALKPAIDGMARESGFEGKIVLIGEPDITVGDCRIEWADGGIVRDSAALSASIREVVDHYIEARMAAAARADRGED